MRPEERRREALERAWEALQARDPEELARRAGARRSGAVLLLRHLGSVLRIDLGARRVGLGGKDPGSALKVLALHYLAGCGEEGPSGSLASFREAPGGEAYYPAFRSRAIDRLAKEFGGSPSELIGAALALGGMDTRGGSAAAELSVFPKLWVTVMVWEGDSEVPASASLLFDRLALDILPTEDLAVAGELVVARLLKARASSAR